MPENKSKHPGMLNIQRHLININVWVCTQNMQTIIVPSLGKVARVIPAECEGISSLVMGSKVNPP